MRAAASIRSQLVPVTAFAGAGRGEAVLAEDVWGIALRSKEEDFTPYILQSHVALLQALPQRTAISQQEVTGPGLPVFDREGRFLGLGASSFGQTFLQFSNENRGGSPVMLVNVEESSAFVPRLRDPAEPGPRAAQRLRAAARLARGVRAWSRWTARSGSSSSSPRSRARS